MRLPRDISGKELAALLGREFGYEFVRQRGSHMRLSTTVGGSHSITIPVHDPLKVGTLSGILDDVARHREMTREEVADRLFGS